jgi:hypothetical protein
MNNINMRWSLQPLLQWKSSKYYYSLCFRSLSYPACTAHAPYCHLWPVLTLQYFPTLSHKWHKFWKQLLNTKCVFILSTTFFWNISHSMKKEVWYHQKCILVFNWNTCHSCMILKKLEFLQTIVQKYSNTKFHENMSSGNRVLPYGQR